MEYRIIHDDNKNMFYINVEDKISYLKYRVVSNIIEFYVTFVDPSLRGRGIAAGLVEDAVAFAKEKGYKILPTCSYTEAYISRKKEYKELLTD